jgi:glycosyltransferase involved in cell wall biosynthesis
MSQDALLTLGVCTMNRPQELEKCLEAVASGTEVPHEVIVSDDSVDEARNKYVSKRFPFVRYQSGPKNGLGPNRNAVIAAMTGTHVAFIDDDVIVATNFCRSAREVVSASSIQTIVTGSEINPFVRHADPRFCA